METKKEKITIKLTDRRPIKIDADEWPTIAKAVNAWHDGEVECQANHKMSCYLRVREKSGTELRFVVYCKYTYSSSFVNERDVNVSGGHLCDDLTKLATTIERVANELASALRDLGHEPPVQGVCRDLYREAIADLPAEEL